MAGADWVMRPTETKSTPDPAIARMVRSVTPPEAGTIRLEYSDYAPQAGRLLAQRVRYQDPRLGTDIVALVDDFELDPPLDAELFRLDGEGQ